MAVPPAAPIDKDDGYSDDCCECSPQMFNSHYHLMASTQRANKAENRFVSVDRMLFLCRLVWINAVMLGELQARDVKQNTNSQRQGIFAPAAEDEYVYWSS